MTLEPTLQPLPATIASRYVPVRLIATGGMGAVYEVEHARTGERLALKVLLRGVGASVEELQRFRREARTSARIKSPHVVRVIDADVAPELAGAPFLVMELLDGADLEREAAGRLSPATVVDWLSQVAPALDKAHGLGIVHRDLKPENLFLARSEDGSVAVKILDFGIVKMTGEDSAATGSGQVLGTPRYMAPEQASRSSAVTSAADRYALGLVAYRLLTGESYYRGDVMCILAQLLHEPLQPPSQRHPELGTAIDAWFLQACHREPTKRFGSACEQIEALARALGLPAGGTNLAEGRSARRAAIGVIGLAAVVGSVVAVVLHWGSRGEVPSSAPPAARAPATSVASQVEVMTQAQQAAAPETPLAPPRVLAPELAAPIAATPIAANRRSTKRRSLPAAPPAPQTRAATPAPAPDPYADQK